VWETCSNAERSAADKHVPRPLREKQRRRQKQKALIWLANDHGTARLLYGRLRGARASLAGGSRCVFAPSSA
jgi:hypothetical protein